MVDESIPQHRCSRKEKCINPLGSVLPFTPEFFSPSKQTKTGFVGTCRVCINADNKRWRDKHPEQWGEINRAHVKHWQKEHPEYMRLRMRTYRSENPELEQLRHRTWQLKHPEENRAKARRYWARKHGAVGAHTAADVRLLLKQAKGLCWWCGKTVDKDYQVDHRIPLSRGGSDDLANLCISCKSCNSSKGGKLPSEWSGRLL